MKTITIRSRLSFLAGAMLALLISVTACGCKSHKNVIVNAQADFATNDVWQLTEMNGREVSLKKGQKIPTIQFNTEAGTFSGNNGCNRYFGSFKDMGNGQMALADFNSTKMACPEAIHKLESKFMELLQRCNRYEIGQYKLQLKNGDRALLTFEKMQ